MPSGNFAEITIGTGLVGTDLGGGVIQISASASAPDPADDTKVWLPLTTVVGGVPELVWSGDDDLVPTLIPLS